MKPKFLEEHNIMAFKQPFQGPKHFSNEKYHIPSAHSSSLDSTAKPTSSRYSCYRCGSNDHWRKNCPHYKHVCRNCSMVGDSASWWYSWKAGNDAHIAGLAGSDHGSPLYCITLLRLPTQYVDVSSTNRAFPSIETAGQTPLFCSTAIRMAAEYAHVPRHLISPPTPSPCHGRGAGQRLFLPHIQKPRKLSPIGSRHCFFFSLLHFLFYANQNKIFYFENFTGRDQGPFSCIFVRIYVFLEDERELF